MGLSRERSLDEMDLVQRLRGEFAQWASGKAVHDHPASCADALPEGWQYVSGLEGYTATLSLHLVRRRYGGWAVLSRGRGGDDERNHLISTSCTLSEEFESAQHWHEVRPQDAAERRNLEWRRAALVGLYDMSDPVEAAEATLFALGGPLTCRPAADASPPGLGAH